MRADAGGTEASIAANHIAGKLKEYLEREKGTSNKCGHDTDGKETAHNFKKEKGERNVLKSPFAHFEIPHSCSSKS